MRDKEEERRGRRRFPYMSNSEGGSALDPADKEELSTYLKQIFPHHVSTFCKREKEKAREK